MFRDQLQSTNKSSSLIHTPPHSFSLLTHPHSSSFLLIPPHSSLLLTPPYHSSSSLLLTPHPHSSLLLTPHSSSLLTPHHSSLLLTPHSSSLLLTPPPHSSLLITPHRSSSLLLSASVCLLCGFIKKVFFCNMLFDQWQSWKVVIAVSIVRKKFNRDDNLKRHMKSQHGWGSKQHTDGNQKSEMDLQLNQFALRHPFTLMVAASTGGGKMWFVKDLLENRVQWISPAPQRIIWIYGQWQPLYAEMQRIIPGIEFVKGIPANIEDEQFLNPAIRNLIVINDLMSEASNDKRICDLCTKGSHHRNLNVICLVQNLYYQGKESRTMSLNSQYLVVFNNPRDQQQITVLARQMYPGQSEKFLNTYRMATSKPFGYLLIDLKPDTLNDKRLWPNVFQQTN